MARPTVVAPVALPELKEAFRSDTDTLLDLSAEGAALYAADPVKLTGYQYCSQAVSLAEAGEFRESLRAASKALHLAQVDGSEDLLALALRDLAIAMSYAGDLDKAEEFARASLTHRAKNPQMAVGPARKTIGDVQVRRHDYAAAIESYELASAASSERFRPLVMVSLANALIDAGNLARSRAVLEGVVLADDNAALRSQVDRSRARLLLAEGKPQQALEAYRALLVQAAGFDSAYSRMWAWEGVSDAQLALGHRDEAVQALAQALDGLDSVRARFRSEEIKTGLFSDAQEVFERAIGLALDQGDARRALEISEKSRARAFLDEVRGRAPVAAKDVDTIALPALQALLAPDERVVQYHVLPARTVVWVISHDDLRVATIPLDRAGITAGVAEFLAAIQSVEHPNDSATVARITGILDRLGAQLVAPLRLAGDERLVIVPHGQLHYLPFQGLRVDGKYLVERHRVSYVPSMSIAAQLISRKGQVPARLLAFGNPTVQGEDDLPSAKDEVRDLQETFKSVTAYIGAEATKARFVEQAPQARVVHVAAHARADAIDPLRSQIYLADVDGKANRLDASEVQAVDLSAVALVTLSACQSARGRIATGDEILGFPRSFLAAGSSALIASLWQVNDTATQSLMRDFYRRLGAGDDLQTAFQAAQLALLRQPIYASPVFWAPFNVMGDWRLRLEH